MIKHKKLMFASLLIILPLLDSLFIPVAFGVQWHSPKVMYLVSAYLIPVKLVLVVIGGFMLARANHPHHQALQKWYTKFLEIVMFLLAGIQLILLSIVCLLYLVAGTQADNYRTRGNITVYTSDIGALNGEAKHHFSYMCSDENSFYNLTSITTLDWLGHFSFTENENTLIIKHNDYKGKAEQTKQIDLSGFGCARD